MPDLETLTPRYPFDIDAVAAHGHAVLDLSMKVSEQNARYAFDLPEIEDLEIRDILHYELHKDQQQTVAERAERLARIPTDLIERCLASSLAELDERLNAFEATQAEVAKVSAALEAKRINAVAAEIVLERDSKLIMRALANFEARATRRLHQLAERDGFEFGEFAILTEKITRLQSLYLPNHKVDAPVEPRIPEPVNVPTVLDHQEKPTVQKPDTQMPRVDAARIVRFTDPTAPDETPSKVATVVIPSAIFAEPDETKAISGREALLPKGTIAENIARVLLANPNKRLTSAELADLIYGDQNNVYDKAGSVRKRAISATISNRSHLIGKYLPEGYSLTTEQEPVYPSAPSEPGRRTLMRTVISLVQ